jgi:hypothetical protein
MRSIKALKGEGSLSLVLKRGRKIGWEAVGMTLV